MHDDVWNLRGLNDSFRLVVLFYPPVERKDTRQGIRSDLDNLAQQEDCLQIQG